MLVVDNLDLAFRLRMVKEIPTKWGGLGTELNASRGAVMTVRRILEETFIQKALQ